jgi:hypothetical protein
MRGDEGIDKREKQVRKLPRDDLLKQFPFSYIQGLVHQAVSRHPVENVAPGLTRPAREAMLDLRFHDALVPNTITLCADAAREIAADLAALGNVEHVSLSFSSVGCTITGIGVTVRHGAYRNPRPLRRHGCVV